MITADQLAAAVRAALADARLPDREPELERPANREHGDWATNVAMQLAKPVGAAPREIAQRIVEALGTPPGVERVEIAGPGFVNFHLSQGALADVVHTVIAQGEQYGHSSAWAGWSANVEFVSANPTGPLHVGHGRQAALGDALAAVLAAVGWSVTREYYFNDAGNQMRLLGASVRAAMRGEAPPAEGYQGAYIGELAAELTSEGFDAEDVEGVTEVAYQRVLARITATLARLGVGHDVFVGERRLHGPEGVPAVVEGMRTAGYAYDADGATWVATSELGDEKDRVAIKSDGQPTYYAADCAYLADKLARGFDHLVYVLGSDHHGYIPRLKAAAAAQGGKPRRVEVVMHQFVKLLRGGQPARMSTRAGQFVTLDELIDEVGADAARYTFLRYSPDVAIDFDLDAVVRQDKDNPVYYVQYSSARIAGITRTATERGVEAGKVGEAALERLASEHELKLIRRLGAYPERVAEAAAERAPHKIARYAEDVAEAFHKFYTECRVVSDDAELTVARYWLCRATWQVLAGALGLLGVTAPERM